MQVGTRRVGRRVGAGPAGAPSVRSGCEAMAHRRPRMQPAPPAEKAANQPQALLEAAPTAECVTAVLGMTAACTRPSWPSCCPPSASAAGLLAVSASSSFTARPTCLSRRAASASVSSSGWRRGRKQRRRWVRRRRRRRRWQVRALTCTVPQLLLRQPSIPEAAPSAPSELTLVCEGQFLSAGARPSSTTSKQQLESAAPSS